MGQLKIGQLFLRLYPPEWVEYLQVEYKHKIEVKPHDHNNASRMKCELEI